MSTIIFNAGAAAGGENQAGVASRRKSRSKEWTYPIGRAAMGRLCDIIGQLLALVVAPGLYRATHMALYAYIKNPDYVPSEPVDEDVYLLGKEEIDRSVRRSRLARERAHARRINKPDGESHAVAERGDGADVGETAAETMAMVEAATVAATVAVAEVVPANEGGQSAEVKPEENGRPEEGGLMGSSVGDSPAEDGSAGNDPLGNGHVGDGSAGRRVAGLRDDVRPQGPSLADWPRRRRVRYPFEADNV